MCQAEKVFIEIPSVRFLISSLSLLNEPCKIYNKSCRFGTAERKFLLYQIASLIGQTIFFTHLITDSLKIYFYTKIRVFIKEIQQEIQALMNLFARLFT